MVDLVLQTTDGASAKRLFIVNANRILGLEFIKKSYCFQKSVLDIEFL